MEIAANKWLAFLASLNIKATMLHQMFTVGLIPMVSVSLKLSLSHSIGSETKQERNEEVKSGPY